jgi:hypothetical protein
MSNRFIGTTNFASSLQVETPIGFNRKHFIFVSAPGSYVKIRTEPTIPSGNPNSNVITATRGLEDEFILIGYTENSVVEDHKRWYYIEFKYEYPSTEFRHLDAEARLNTSISPNPEVYPVVPVGKRGWINELALGYIASSYNNFLWDLGAFSNVLNKPGNSLSQYSENDSLSDRLIRLRQMTHGTEVNYDLVLNTAALYPNYNGGPHQDELPDLNNTTVNDPPHTTEPIKTDIRLFKDFNHFYLDINGKRYAIDFQHVMLQVDGYTSGSTFIYYPYDFFPVNQYPPYATTKYTLNTLDVIWAGDLSGIAPDLFFHLRENQENEFLYAKRVASTIDNNLTRAQLFSKYITEIFLFYYKGIVPERDLIADFIGFLVTQNINKYANDVGDFSKTAAFPGIKKAFDTFKADPEKFILDSIIIFLKVKGFDTPIGNLCAYTIADNPSYTSKISKPIADNTGIFYRFRLLTEKTGFDFGVDLPAGVETQLPLIRFVFNLFLEKYRKKYCE